MNVAQLRPGDWFLYRGEAVRVLNATANRHDRTVLVTYRFAGVHGRIRQARFPDGDHVTATDPPDGDTS
jgi:hypothetical protein